MEFQVRAQPVTVALSVRTGRGGDADEFDGGRVVGWSGDRGVSGRHRARVVGGAQAAASWARSGSMNRKQAADVSPSATVAITAPSVSRGVRGSSWARLNSLVCAQPSARTRSGDDGLGDPPAPTPAPRNNTMPSASSCQRGKPEPARDGEPSTQGGAVTARVHANNVVTTSRTPAPQHRGQAQRQQRSGPRTAPGPAGSPPPPPHHRVGRPRGRRRGPARGRRATGGSGGTCSGASARFRRPRPPPPRTCETFRYVLYKRY